MFVAEKDAPVSTHVDRFQHGINRFAISRDGKLRATSDVDMNVVIESEGTVIFNENFSSANEKIKPTERVRGLAFSPDGSQIYIAAGEKLWAIGAYDGQIRWSYVAPRSFGFLIISPMTLDVSTKGEIAVAFDNGSVKVWDSRGELRARWNDNDCPRTLKYAADAGRIVGTDSFSLCIWDLANLKAKRKIVMPDRVYGMDLNQAGTIAAVRTLKEVLIWDLERASRICSIPVEPGTPIVALHPSKPLVACGEGSRISFSALSGQFLSRHELDAASGLCMAFDHSGSELIVGCTHHRVEAIKFDF